MAQKQTQSTPQGNKISNYLTVIVLIVLALSLVALFIAAETFVSDQTANGQLTAGIFAGIGGIALVMCLFLLYQSRRQAADVKLEIPKVMTTIECQSSGCKNKTVREFQRGDYVFKDIEGPCGKCGGKQMITAIYKEVKEKEKTYAV